MAHKKKYLVTRNAEGRIEGIANVDALNVIFGKPKSKRCKLPMATIFFAHPNIRDVWIINGVKFSRGKFEVPRALAKQIAAMEKEVPRYGFRYFRSHEQPAKSGGAR